MKQTYFFILFLLLLSVNTICAQNMKSFCGGSGTASDPYQICTPQDLADLATDVNLGGNASEGIHYMLMNNLDFAGFNYGNAGGWIPIGNGQSPDRIFKGNFNGNGKLISNLTINRPTEDYQGVFGRVSNATFINIGIENCNISGYNSVGVLAGFNGGSPIENCYAKGNVSGNNYVGGLVGRNFTNSAITNCYATGNVNGNVWVGGLTGVSDSNSPIENCYATGNITGTSLVGGLAGRSISIANSYATGDVTGTSQVGGLSGANGTSDNSGFLTNSYAIGNVTGNNHVGGLVGSNMSLVENSYATGNVTGNDQVGGLVGSHGWSDISNCYALNCKVEALTGTNVGRVAYSNILATFSNNYAHIQMELWANGAPISPTPAPNNQHGANVSFQQATSPAQFPTQAWLTGTSPAWTFNYGSYNTAPGTNLPILSAFMPSAFPNAVQSPKVEICSETGNTDCANGTILFREDFGGNSPSDPPIMSNQDMQVLYGDKIIGYTPSQTPAGAGLYSIRKEGYHHGNWWIWMDDHTHPYDYTRGYLLQVDGSNDPSGQFYRTKIDNLCAGSTLYFSMWAASVAPGFQRANLSIIIEDLSGTELQRLNTGEIPNAGGCNTQNCISVSDPFACNDWTHYGITFTITGSTPSVIFKIMNNNSSPMGNDFVIDDIEIRLCTPPVNVIAPVEAVCVGSSAQFTGSFINDGTFTPPLEYQWLYSTTGDLTSPNSWVAIAGGNSLTLNIPNVTANHQGYYRLAVAGYGSINLENCRAMSDPIFLEVVKNFWIKIRNVRY